MLGLLLALFISAHAADKPLVPKKSWNVSFKWKAVPKANAYRIQISTEKLFENKLVDQRVAKPNFDWKFQPGMEQGKQEVFYRVASISHQGRVGSFSAPKTLTIPIEIIKESYKHYEIALPKYVPRVTGLRFHLYGGGGLGAINQVSNNTLIRKLASPPFRQFQWGGDLEYRISENLFSKVLSEFQWLTYREPEFGTSNESLLLYQVETSLLFQKGGFLVGFSVIAMNSFRWIRPIGTIERRVKTSVGPGFVLAKNISSKTLLLPNETQLSLSTPMTGALSDGFWGFNIRLTSSWKILEILSFWRASLYARLTLQNQFEKWLEEEQTQAHRWAGFAALSLHFEPF